jgi:hypothetical protein
MQANVILRFIEVAQPSEFGDIHAMLTSSGPPFDAIVDLGGRLTLLGGTFQRIGVRNRGKRHFTVQQLLAGVEDLAIVSIADPIDPSNYFGFAELALDSHSEHSGK